MTSEHGYASFLNAFKFTSDAIAIIREGKIVFISDLVSEMFPELTIGTPVRELVSEDVLRVFSDPFSNSTKMRKGVVIGIWRCSVRVSYLEHFSVVTLSDIRHKDADQEDAIPLDKWLSFECAQLRGPILSISSVLPLIKKALPPDYLSAVSESLALINQSCCKAQKSLKNIHHILNRLSGDDKKEIVDLSVLCKSFVESFRMFFASQNIMISDTIPAKSLLSYCSISDIRRAVYEILDFFVDCTGESGELEFALEESGAQAEIRISSPTSKLDPEKFCEFSGPNKSSRAQLIASVAEMHGGYIKYSPQLGYIRFVIDMTTPELGFVRAAKAEYEAGDCDLLTELSETLPLCYYMP